MTATGTRVVPAVLALVGVLYAWRATSYGLGSLQEPGPGLLPLVAGLGLVLTAAALLRGRTAPATPVPVGEPEPAVHDEPGARLRPAAALLVAAVVCAAVVWQSRVIGLLPAASLAAAATAFLMRARWWSALATGLGFFVVGYLLFEQWLQVPLPHGYLRF